MTLGSCGCSESHTLFKGVNEILPYCVHVLLMWIKFDIQGASKIHPVIPSLVKTGTVKTP
jgi:hypothetical protein